MIIAQPFEPVKMPVYDLMPEETELVAAWDVQAALGMGRLCKRVLEAVGYAGT